MKASHSQNQPDQLKLPRCDNVFHHKKFETEKHIFSMLEPRVSGIFYCIQGDQLVADLMCNPFRPQRPMMQPLSVKAPEEEIKKEREDKVSSSTKESSSEISDHFSYFSLENMDEKGP
jgi:hypothetical protein